jgi:cardiolipin synthase
MSGPGEDEKNSRRVYLLSIASARKTIRIAHSYFLPDDFAMKLLIDARRRGVKVEIITPGIINFNIVRRASRSRWKRLLEAGVEFYEYEPVKYHLKLMIVDDIWVTAGSVNFDARSFHINDEANLIVRNEEFAASQIATFERDKSFSTRVDPEKFQHRPFWMKWFETLSGLLRFEL